MKSSLRIAGRDVPVTNLDKVLYPEAGFTKAQVIDYYVRIAPALLPYLKDRPITLKRYPDGVDGFFFYEKRCPPGRPAWVRTAKVPKSEGGEIPYCVMNSLPALVWAANLADLELHTFLHAAPRIEEPQFLAFDLDPGPPADIRLCCRVGLWLRDVFAALGMESFPKTSGSKGLQVYVPLNSGATYEETKPFARAAAELMERAAPGEVVSKMTKALRGGKVLVDWSQNDARKTTVNVYSLRAKNRPTVSTPVSWKEVSKFLEDGGRLSFEWDEVLARVARDGDCFAPVLTLRQKLPPVSALESHVK